MLLMGLSCPWSGWLAFMSVRAVNWGEAAATSCVETHFSDMMFAAGSKLRAECYAPSKLASARTQFVALRGQAAAAAMICASAASKSETAGLLLVLPLLLYGLQCVESHFIVALRLLRSKCGFHCAKVLSVCP